MTEEKRALGLLSLLTLGLNGIVGVGIFFAPKEVATLVPGGAGIAVYAATALALLPIAAAYAILGGRFDEDGGSYVWARAAFGPTVGFAVGWIAYASALFSTAAVVAGLSEQIAPLLGIAAGLGTRALGLGFVLLLAAIAASGLRPSAFAWSALTFLKLLPLVLVALALAWMRPKIPQNPAPPAPGQFARAALVVVFALQGFEIVPVPAGHARRSGHAVPVATLGSVMLAAMLYLALHAACVAALPNLAHTRAPLASAARVLGGPGLGTAVAFGTNLSALGIAFGMFAMTPRYLSALGRRDGLGLALSREDARGVPQISLWSSSAAVAVLVSSGGLTELFALSSVAVLAQYAVTAAALAVLSVRRVRGLDRRHVWPVPFALAAILLIGRAAEPRELVVAAAVLGVGALLLMTRRSRALQP